MKEEMDILREVGSTAAAHGSTALSEMLGRKISLSVPSVKIIPSQEITKTLNIEGIAITIQTKILEGLKGESLYIVLEEKNAYKLVDICYRMEESLKKVSLFTEMAMSVLKEIGNVVSAAYIGALAYFLKKLIIPSLPLLINAPFQEVAKSIAQAYSNKEGVLVVESTFEETKEKIKGNFWLILTPGAAEEIKESCKKILENIK